MAAAVRTNHDLEFGIDHCDHDQVSGLKRHLHRGHDRVVCESSETYLSSFHRSRRSVDGSGPKCSLRSQTFHPMCLPDACTQRPTGKFPVVACGLKESHSSTFFTRAFDLIYEVLGQILGLAIGQNSACLPPRKSHVVHRCYCLRDLTRRCTRYWHPRTRLPQSRKL